jgi:hypothetical protein
VGSCHRNLRGRRWTETYLNSAANLREKVGRTPPLTRKSAPSNFHLHSNSLEGRLSKSNPIWNLLLAAPSLPDQNDLPSEPVDQATTTQVYLTYYVQTKPINASPPHTRTVPSWAPIRLSTDERLPTYPTSTPDIHTYLRVLTPIHPPTYPPTETPLHTRAARCRCRIRQHRRHRAPNPVSRPVCLLQPARHTPRLPFPVHLFFHKTQQGRGARTITPDMIHHAFGY